MARTKFSEETTRLQTAAGEAIDAFLRSANKDRFDSGVLDASDYEEYPEFVTLDTAHLTAWIVTGQFQTFDDPEAAAVINSGAAVAVSIKSGLAKYANAYWA